MLEIYKATSKYEMDLSGNFYRLKHLKQRDENDLKDFLFKKPER